MALRCGEGAPIAKERANSHVLGASVAVCSKEGSARRQIKTLGHLPHDVVGDDEVGDDDDHGNREVC